MYPSQPFLSICHLKVNFKITKMSVDKYDPEFLEKRRVALLVCSTLSPVLAAKVAQPGPLSLAFVFLSAMQPVGPNWTVAPTIRSYLL